MSDLIEAAELVAYDDDRMQRERVLNYHRIVAYYERAAPSIAKDVHGFAARVRQGQDAVAKHLYRSEENGTHDVHAEG